MLAAHVVQLSDGGVDLANLSSRRRRHRPDRCMSPERRVLARTVDREIIRDRICIGDGLRPLCIAGHPGIYCAGINRIAQFLAPLYFPLWTSYRPADSCVTPPGGRSRRAAL